MSKNNCSIVSKIGRNIYFIQIAMDYCCYNTYNTDCWYFDI